MNDHTPSSHDALGAFETSLAPASGHFDDAVPGAELDDDGGGDDIRRWSGRVMDGYRLERLIGRGSSGFVFLASDSSLQRQVAVKVLARRENKADPANARLIGMFVREARVAATMNHPHSVHIYSVNSLDGWWYMAMEYLEGGTLGDLLRRCGPLDCTQACRHAAEAASALCNAHELGIVHRDVKPGNLMLTRSGHCKVVDFGFAQDPAADGTGKHNMAGTPMYMAPEVIAQRKATAKSDVYSLGITLYVLLSGEKPFDAQNVEELYRLHREQMPAHLGQLCPHLPPPLCDLVMRMLAKEPAGRPGMQSVARALRALAHMGENGPMAGSLSASGLHGLSLSNPPTRTPEAPARRGWLPWAIAGGALGAAVMAVMLLRPATPAVAVAPAAAPVQAGDRKELDELKSMVASMRQSKDDEAKTQLTVQVALKAAQDAKQEQARLAAEAQRLAQAAKAAQEGQNAQTARAAQAERDAAEAKAALTAEIARLDAKRTAAETALRQAQAAEADATREKNTKALAVRQQAMGLLDRARPLEQESTGGRAMALIEQALALDPDYPEAKQAAARVRALYVRAPGTRITNTCDMPLAWIPAGAFQMGTPDGQDGHQRDEASHAVTLSHPFYMGASEVSVAQFRKVMGADWKSRDGVPKDAAEANGNPDLPMTFVSWNDAAAFCRRLSEREGRTYRLPTEAEWEYACRAGSATVFTFGDALPAGSAVQAAGPAKCGASRANAWGLCDMHGNAAEWCADWYAPYDTAAKSDPAGPAQPADPDLGARAVRGGNWKQAPRFARSGCRGSQMPVIQSPTIGFRVVLEAPTLEATR